MQIDKIYRLQTRIDYQDDLTINNEFYTSREETLERLADFKDEITEAYADDDGIEYEIQIVLQEIKLSNIEDIDYDAKETLLCEWVCDEESTEEQWDDMRKNGKEVDKSIQIGMWKDYELTHGLVNNCKRCKSDKNLTYNYKGDYYCNNNRCFNILFSRLVADECIVVADDRSTSFDRYYNSRGEYIGDDTCTNRHIINQVPEVKKYKEDGE